MNDNQMVTEIRKGNREKPLKILYEEFPKVQAKIESSGGNREIAEEIFNDSLLLLIEKVENPEFRLTSKLSTYLFGIARLLFMNRLRKEQKLATAPLEWSDTLIITNEDIDYSEERENKLAALEKILDRITERCKKIFLFFYFEQRSMKEIAETLQFSSVNSAKTQKYKCLEKAIQLSHNPNL